MCKLWKDLQGLRIPIEAQKEAPCGALSKTIAREDSHVPLNIYGRGEGFSPACLRDNGCVKKEQKRTKREEGRAM